MINKTVLMIGIGVLGIGTGYLLAPSPKEIPKEEVSLAVTMPADSPKVSDTEKPESEKSANNQPIIIQNQPSSFDSGISPVTAGILGYMLGGNSSRNDSHTVIHENHYRDDPVRSTVPNVKPQNRDRGFFSLFGSNKIKDRTESKPTVGVPNTHIEKTPTFQKARVKTEKKSFFGSSNKPKSKSSFWGTRTASPKKTSWFSGTKTRSIFSRRGRK